MFDDDWDFLGNKWKGSDWHREYGDDIAVPEIKFCIHEWKPILLLTSTVYNCEKCGMKKEDYEKDLNDIPF